MTNIKKPLHDTDFNLWIEQTAEAIKNRDLNNMDWDNLLEEIEDMGARDKRALRSYTMRLIEHIFKLQYWQSERERNENGWRIEINNFRTQIENILEDSPSLQRYLQENYLDWYAKSIENINSSKVFKIPEHNAIAISDIMRKDYFGD